ncbi:hypothetical protein D3C76_1440410 [compost metagenome]
MYGTKKLPQLPEKVNIAIVAIPGNINGATIRLNPFQTEAPSIHADSSRSIGTESMKFFIIQMPYGSEDAVRNSIVAMMLFCILKNRNI